MASPAVHLDCETYAFTLEEQTPPVVSLAWCYRPEVRVGRDQAGHLVARDDIVFPWRGMQAIDCLGGHGPSWPEVTRPDIATGDEIIDAFRELLATDITLQGLNVAFDLHVLLAEADRRGLNLWREAFEMLEAGRLRDTELDEKLLYIAYGANVYKTGLAALSERYLGADIGADKEVGSVRYQYGDLVDTPFDLWPFDSKRYALDDVILDRAVARCQLDAALRTFGKPSIPDQVARPIWRFCLHLQSARGIITDWEKARRARDSLTDVSGLLMSVLVRAGLVRSKVIFTGKGAVEEGDRVTVDGNPATFRYRSTKKGDPSNKARHALVQFDDGDEAIVELRDVTSEQGVKHTKNMKEIRRRIAETFAELGQNAPLTATDLVKTDRETLLAVADVSGDEGLRCLTAKGKVDKLLSTYIETLCVRRPVHWRYDALRDTGRTSASGQRFLVENDEGVMIKMRDGTNVQNFPGEAALRKAATEVYKFIDPERAEDKEAIARWADQHDPRSMVVARPGYLFSIYDYKALEFGAMARVLNVLFKKPSTLAKVVNEGLDAHLYTGVRVHHTMWSEALTYEEIVDRHAQSADAAKKGQTLKPWMQRVTNTRKISKVVNFGFLGAMGAAAFQVFAASSYGVKIDLKTSHGLRGAFLASYPEIPIYFKMVGQSLDQGMPVVQIGSGRVRRGCTYASACNSRFQGLAADGAMEANYRLTKAAYVDAASPMYGSRPLIFEHDAFITEVPIDRAEEAHAEIARHMIEGMAVYFHDRKRPELSVKVGVDGFIAHVAPGDRYSRWSKG